MKITEHEMHGLLAGKCLPGDMRLNEDLPSYLVRKFDELQQKLDALAASESAQATINTLQQRVGALAAENAALKELGDKLNDMHNNLNGEGTGIQGRAEVACQQVALEVAIDEFDAIKTPATDAYRNSLRAEGIHFAANRILAAWECGFINDTPEQAQDIYGAVLSALEFLPNASPEEFKRDYADEVRASIAEQLRSGTHDTADKAG